MKQHTLNRSQCCGHRTIVTSIDSNIQYKEVKSNFLCGFLDKNQLNQCAFNRLSIVNFAIVVYVKFNRNYLVDIHFWFVSHYRFSLDCRNYAYLFSFSIQALVMLIQSIQLFFFIHYFVWCLLVSIKYIIVSIGSTSNLASKFYLLWQLTCAPFFFN